MQQQVDKGDALTTAPGKRTSVATLNETKFALLSDETTCRKVKAPIQQSAGTFNPQVNEGNFISQTQSNTYGNIAGLGSRDVRK